MINYENLNQLQKKLFSLMQQTMKLTRSSDSERLKRLNNKLEQIMRKIIIANEFAEKNTICISGVQGAGKTTLVEKFYGIDDKYMTIALGRGEKLPILITEKSDCKSITATRVYLKKQNDEITKCRETISSDEFINFSKNCEDSMYLELFVPMKHMYNENVSFVLLPGFENNTSYWQSLIDFSLNSSNSAILVFTQNDFASGSNEKVCKKLQEIFRNENPKSDPKIIYTISHSDLINDYDEIRNNVIDSLNIPSGQEDRLVFSGVFPSKKQNEEWINNLKKAIYKYTIGGNSGLEKNKKYIGDLIENEILPILDEIYEISSDNGNEIISNKKNSSILEGFDECSLKIKRNLEKILQNKLKLSENKSFKKLDEICMDRTKAKQYNVINPFKGKFAVSLFGKSPKDYIKEERFLNELLKNDNDKYFYEIAFEESIINLMTTLSTKNNNTKKILLNDDNHSSVFDDFFEDKHTAEIGVNENYTNVLNDVSFLLQPKLNNNLCFQHDNIQEVIKVLTELATAYFGCFSNYMITGKDDFLKEKMDISSIDKSVNKEINSKNMFSLSLLGITGLDMINDGKINLIPQIAESLAVSTPVVAGVVAGIIALCATKAIITDINKLNVETYFDMKNSISAINTSVKYNFLEAYDDYMYGIREQIQNNLLDLNRCNNNITIKYNIISILNNLSDDFNSIFKDVKEGSYELARAFT